MSFFDVRKWYSFLSLSNEADVVRKKPAPAYVDAAGEIDSRWEWDRSLRTRPRQSRLRGASSERTLTETSQPTTPRSYLRKAGRGEESLTGSLAGTDVLSTSWEAETPRSRRDRTESALSDEHEYERISKLSLEEHRDNVFSSQQADKPHLSGAHVQPGNVSDPDLLSKSEEPQSHRSDIVPRSSGRWGKKVFGFGTDSTAVYSKVYKEKDTGRLTSSDDDLLMTRQADDHTSDNVLPGTSMPPVPPKSWESEQPEDFEHLESLQNKKRFGKLNSAAKEKRRGFVFSNQPASSPSAISTDSLQREQGLVTDTDTGPYFTVEPKNQFKVTTAVEEPRLPKVEQVHVPAGLDEVPASPSGYHSSSPDPAKDGTPSPSKSPGKKKGFFKFPSLKKKKKTSVSGIEDNATHSSLTTMEVQDDIVPPSIEQILAELRKEHLQKQIQAESETDPLARPPRGQLKKVPPPVLPKTWLKDDKIKRPLKTYFPESSPVISSVKERMLEDETPPLDVTDTGCSQVPETMASFFSREHEVTVLPKEVSPPVPTSRMLSSFSSSPQNKSKDLPDAAPRRRHNLEVTTLTSEVRCQKDEFIGTDDSNNFLVSEQESMVLNLTANALAPGGELADHTVDVAPDAELQNWPDEPDNAPKSASKKGLFKFKLKKRKQSQDNSSTAIMSVAPGQDETFIEQPPSVDEPESIKPVSRPCEPVISGEDYPSPILATSEQSKGFEVPGKSKQKQFNFKLSSMRKKKEDKKMKKRGSLGDLNTGNIASEPPSEKGNMIDAYLRSLAMRPQPPPVEHNRSNDQLGIPLVS